MSQVLQYCISFISSYLLRSLPNMVKCESMLGMVVDRSQVLRLNNVKSERKVRLVLGSEANI